MKVGAYIRITMGPFADRYGQVKAMDGDMGRLTVKWALGSGKGLILAFSYYVITLF